MDWQADYARKRVTAPRALEVVKSGDRVVFAHACGEPLDLVDALVARADELRHVEIVHMVAMGKGEYCKPEYAESFFHNSLFTGASSREAVREGRGDYTPVFFHEIPGLFLNGYLPVDVALVHLSPPDRHGWCSFGVSVDYTKAAASVAACVIAQVNPNMPRTHGDAFIHVSQIDHVVESEQPIIELPPPRIGPVEEAIGKNIAGLVDDGACLQLGIGGIPDAVLLFLHEKNDLGIHTEMFSEGVVDLYNEGVITNARKTLHRDKMVANFLMGTRRLYDFVDDNPAVNMFPVSYVNDPYVIGQNDGVVAINSAIEVDIMGQVVADSMGPVQYTGIGGQVDFVRGAARSTGGKAIIALPSTAKKGTVSRIVAKIADGAAVTTMRADVDYVVTEHGVAHLKGKRLRERAQALIEIADPAFRDKLIAGVKQLRGEGWLRRHEGDLVRPSASQPLPTKRP
jgi:4-hydroxybutyrate CoA-transferase